MSPGPAATVAGADLPTQVPAHQVVLADFSMTFEVPPQLGPATGSSEWPLDDVAVPSGVRNVGFELTRTNGPGTAMSDSCRVLSGDRLVGEATFTDGEAYGLAAGEEICGVRAWHLEPGDYSVVYVLDEVAPQSTHTVRLRVVADLEPWRPAQW